MNPSQKSPEMEQALIDMFGFDRRSQIKANLCCPPPIGCGGPATEFKDALSQKEYTISGLCQKCQDAVFDAEPDEEFVEATIATPPEPPQYQPGPNDWVSEDYQMFSGQGEAAHHRYHKHIGKSGRIWLVSDGDAPAENVYVANNPQNTTHRSQGFEGFGGATLTFQLVDGSTIDLHGPWHSCADGLFNDTGVDVRNTHRTFVVLGMDRKMIYRNRWDGYGRTVICDVVYKDAQPTHGHYDRYKELMAQFPQAKYYYMCSKGGSSSGMTDTEQARYNQERGRKLSVKP